MVGTETLPYHSVVWVTVGMVQLPRTLWTYWLSEDKPGSPSCEPLLGRGNPTDMPCCSYTELSACLRVICGYTPPPPDYFTPLPEELDGGAMWIVRVAFIENEKPKRKIDEGAVLPPQTTIFPTQPGAYWYRPVGLAHVLLVEVRLTEGELTVWWADRPIAIAKLTGYWRGPIPLSTGPGSSQTVRSYPRFPCALPLTPRGALSRLTTTSRTKDA